MKINQTIRQRRQALGLTQEQLAEALNVSRQSVSKWETGQSVPDLDKIIRMADLFGVSVDELVREGEPPAPPQTEPRVVCLMQEKKGFTGTQKAGICMEVLGVVLFLLGVMRQESVAAVIGEALLLLGLPLLLAKKHPWLILGWLAVGLSLLVFNPYTSAGPWGLMGGLRYLHEFIYEYHSFTILMFAGIGIVRSLLALALLLSTLRAVLRRLRGAPPAPGEKSRD